MKTVYTTTILIVTFLFITCTNVSKGQENTNSGEEKGIAVSAADNNFSMYPKVKDGYKRYVIQVPERENEYNYEVEVIVGKKMEVDCNNYSLTGELKEVFIEGWGYSYLEFPKDYQTIGTLRGCEDDTKRTLFVRGNSVKKYYNSRSPIVVYAPKDLEVKYSIWEKGKEEKSAEELP